MVLLVRRAHPPRRGEWSLPGGHIAAREPPARALAREMAEETGLTPVRAIPFARVLIRHRDGPLYRILCFRVFAWHGRARAGDDAATLAWVALSRLPGILRRRQTRRVIADGAALPVRSAVSRPRRYE